jgi:hypothetical protein
MKREEEVGKYWYGPGLVKLKQDLEDLLGIELEFDLGLNEKGEIVFWAENPAARDFATVISRKLRGDIGESNRRLRRLLYYRKHLHEVAQFRPSVFEELRSDFRESGSDRGNFYGTMFEMEIAASLARKEIPFEKQEAPDFLMSTREEEVGVECTAASKIRGRSLPLEKLYEKIRGKGGKGYLGLSDALFIDVTGVHYASGGDGKPGMSSVERNLKETMSQSIHRKGIGAAVAFLRVAHDEGSKETIYSRVDHWKAEEPLKQFLDAAYPFGDRPIDLQTIRYLPQN